MEQKEGVQLEVPGEVTPSELREIYLISTDIRN